MSDARFIPVIAAIGEYVDRPTNSVDGLEPLALMAQAIRRADDEAKGRLLAKVDSIDVVNQISWPYAAPADELCARLGIAPSRRHYGVVGGETPIKFLHEAALRIRAGQSDCAIVCGGEAHQTLARAAKAQIELPWTPKPDIAAASVRSQDTAHPLAKRIGVHIPVTVYPLYEAAGSFAAGLTPEQATQENAQLWSAMSRVAAANPFAWIRKPVEPAEIVTPSSTNRMIATPYTKFQVANIAVNQAAAVIVTSLAAAREAGLDDGRLVFIGDGHSAGEPQDYLARDGYHHCVARDAVLDAAMAASPQGFNFHELYSCFPIVPKAARLRLGLPSTADITVTGGLTFFGAPLNNYMAHALCAMVRRLRDAGGHALLYGQGGFMTKHYALSIAMHPPHQPQAIAAISVQGEVVRRYGAVPPFDPQPQGPARIESHTVIHDRDGTRTGALIIRTDAEARSLAIIPASDDDGLAQLEAPQAYAIERRGDVVTGPGGLPEWRFH